MENTHLCPRREEIDTSIFKMSVRDTWDDRNGYLACSHCGSLHPDPFMEAASKGVRLGPTDKNYKVYVDGFGSGKFYFQHLSDEQRREFVRLLNEKKVAFSHPGRFLVLPFFIQVEKPA